jgi:hypothetical protein
MVDRNAAKMTAMFVLGCALLFLCWVMFGYLASTPDGKQEGFMGVAWSANIRDLHDMKLMGEDGEQKFYTRGGEKLDTPEIVPDKVVYGFYKGRFYNAMIYFSSMKSFEKMKDRVSREHGNPFRPDESGKKFFWASNKVNILLTFDDGLNQGRISYFYQPIEAEIEQDEKSRPDHQPQSKS